MSNQLQYALINKNNGITILGSTIVIKKKGFINRITDKHLVELFDIAPRFKLRDDSGVCFDRNDNFCSFGNTENNYFIHHLLPRMISKNHLQQTLDLG